MERKPVLLILTSTDEYGGASAVLSSAVSAAGTHNVVVLDERKYDGRIKGGLLDRLMFWNDEYKLFAAKKTTAKQVIESRRAERGGGKLSGRNRRIANAVKRYRPECVVTLTPYAQAAAADAKRKSGFAAPLIYFMSGFTAKESDASDGADVYVVENGDMKTALTRAGVPSSRIMTMGLPYDAAGLTPLEIESAKQELGLPKTPTVFVNARGRKTAVELAKLLTDQGGIINSVFYTEEAKTASALRAESDAAAGESNLVVLTKPELFDEYMGVSDIVVTRYDPSVVYRAFKTGKPVIVLPERKSAAADIAYLTAENLIIRTADNIDVVASVYKLMQTDTAAELTENGIRRTEMYSLDNAVGYLTGFMGM